MNKPDSMTAFLRMSYDVIYSSHKTAYATTVKHVLSGHSKIDKTKILMANGSLMKVENIAECSNGHSAILSTCIKQ